MCRQDGGWLAAVGLALMVTACGSSTPSSPSPGGGGGSNSSTTITITSSGVSPKSVTVPLGTRVTFLNNDSRAHFMASNPHPEHTDCPAINDVGTLQPGQNRLTGNLTVTRTCGFHDHDNPTNTGLQGSIVIQ